MTTEPASRRDEPDFDVVPKVEILGIGVSCCSLDSAAARIAGWAGGEHVGRARYACATSVHGVVTAARDASFATILNQADLVAPDGVPLVWVGRILGKRSMERMFGPELMLRICQKSPRGTRHFFYGGEPGVAEELGKRLSSRYPGVEVAGTYCPPFRALSPEEMKSIADTINRSRADIVWVGLSTPKQERWIGAICDALRVKVLVSVGAAFDYHTGRLRYAPSWAQRAGLEWAYRLIQEPRRLWRRYAYNNPVFVGLVLKQLLGIRRGPDKAPRSSVAN